jgi:hypothetical protein
MGVRVYTTLGDLERDLKIIATEFKPRAARDVRDVAQDGNRAGKANAQRTAPTHGKHYPKAFSAERRGILEWEWGPDAGMPQGGMSFENGSRNQPPHKDIAKAADLHGAGALERKVDRTIDGLFWP